MPAEHHVLTLTGSAQALSSIAGATTNPLRTLFVSAGTANVNPVYIGGSNQAVSSTVYGVRIRAPVSSEPVAPFVYMETQSQHGHLKLSDIYVLGSNAEKL